MDTTLTLLRSAFSAALAATVPAVLAMALTAAGPARAAETATQETPMMKAKGTFEVKLTPQPIPEGYGRMSIEKIWSGDLEGSSQGEMLSTMSEGVQGSGAYVAIEKVTARLGGKSGSFVFHHTGLMRRGAPSLAVEVVPDSGTGELTGLAGRLTIDIRDGKHFYEFDYSLPAPAPAAH